jgi:hypothetical protein
MQWVILSVEEIGLEKIMRRSAGMGLAAALLLSGVTLAIAQNGVAKGGHAATKNRSPYRYHYGYSDYYARPYYDPYFCRPPYYVLGYPVPHYGYMGWCGWR